ncbi:MAG TPA: hypothetical protein VMI56_20830, partial [Reyranella sp.]|nr:hypothetical protein [Reyranella sp.]
MLKRRPELKCDKRVVFFAPLTHYLRGVIFAQPWSSRAFQVWAFTLQLFAGDPEFNVGEHPGSFRRFPHEWPEDPEGTSRLLCDHIERTCLPMVESMTNPQEHRRDPSYVFGPLRPEDDPLSSPLYCFRAAVGACFEGDFDLAESLTTDFPLLIRYHEADGLLDKLHFSFARRNRHLLKLLREDRSAIPGLLHEW